MRSLLLGAALASGFAQVAYAGPIENACLRGGRSAATRELCGCIQQAADQTLSRTDQKLASKFFKDPAMAQDVRQSDRSSHEAFWLRYKKFAETAELYCGPRG